LRFSEAINKPEAEARCRASAHIPLVPDRSVCVLPSRRRITAPVMPKPSKRHVEGSGQPPCGPLCEFSRVVSAGAA